MIFPGEPTDNNEVVVFRKIKKFHFLIFRTKVVLQVFFEDFFRKLEEKWGIFSFLWDFFLYTGEVLPKLHFREVLIKMKKFKNELFHFRGFTCPGVLGFLKDTSFSLTGWEKYIRNGIGFAVTARFWARMGAKFARRIRAEEAKSVEGRPLAVTARA